MRYEVTITLVGASKPPDDIGPGDVMTLRDRIAAWLFERLIGTIEVGEWEEVEPGVERIDSVWDPGFVSPFVATMPVPEMEDLAEGVYREQFTDAGVEFDSLTVDIIEAPED